MGPVGLLGIIISFSGIPFAFPGKTNRYFMGFLLLLMHITLMVVYYSYIQSHDADTRFYYYDPYGMVRTPLQLGSIMVLRFIQLMRDYFGGSYFEYFILFQSFGYWGIVILSRTISEMKIPAHLRLASSASTAVLFLPSLHFWTSAIGKDSPMFLGTSIVAWAMGKLSKRWPAYIAAMALMTMIRPHIALISMAALMFALVFDRRYKGGTKIFFAAVALLSTGYLVAGTGAVAKVDLTDPSSVADLVTRMQNMSVIGSTQVQGPFAVRLLSLLFRPFLLDANGIFGIISSFENMLFLGGFLIMVMNFRLVLSYSRDWVFAKYCLWFTLLITLSLAAVYYNVGLGLRERVMVYPTLLPLMLMGLTAAIVRPHRVAGQPVTTAQRTAMRERGSPGALPKDHLKPGEAGP
jgi:hypothetical protein